MKNVLITGGSGFVGRSLIEELLKKYPDIEITSLSRSEGTISRLMMGCNDKRLTIEMVDIRDAEAVHHALRDKDTVIHLAAMKRVDLCENECHEAAAINVVGTMNILDAFQGKTFILMSTDKAVEPCNCYGATKLVAERLVLERAKKSSDGARFMIVRSGNIVGSTGSVMDIWKNQILKSNEITVTDVNMTRFYTTVEGVVKLYVAVLDRGENGMLYFTPRGEAQVLKEIVDKAIKLFGNEKTKINITGLRIGERMDEKMRHDGELNTVSGFEE
ncbi:MAG: polysaccharide biosynthesis protein [Dehalococcoidales bacterium]|nr:polysaccharide biosynthesis protein [Dehalococcoidales bacterium]